jgi:hypothetical protein
MRQRIDHVEDLVKRLVADRPQQVSSPADIVVVTPDSNKSGPGLAVAVANGDEKLVLEDSAWLNRGGADWLAVLQEVLDLALSHPKP